LLKHRAAA